MKGFRKNMKVVAGANEPTNQNYLDANKNTIQKQGIKRVKIHDRYDRDTKKAYYDIAIVTLRRPLK